MKKSKKKRLIVTGLILMFCFIPLFAILAGIAGYFLPTQRYYSHVTMELKDYVYSAGGSRGSNTNNAHWQMDPSFIHSQFQIMRSRDILDPVIAELDLTKKLAQNGESLSEAGAYQILVSMLDLRKERSKSGSGPSYLTQLIDIGVYANNPQLAADIANEVADAYVKARDKEVANFSKIGFEEAKGQVERLQKETNEAYAKLVKLAPKGSIEDIANPRSQITKAQAEEYNAAKKIYEAKRALLASATKNLKAQGMQKNITFEPAHIWERAVPDPIPAKPNMMIIILLGAAIGIPFAIVGFVLFLVGLCTRDDDPQRVATPA